MAVILVLLAWSALLLAAVPVGLPVGTERRRPPLPPWVVPVLASGPGLVAGSPALIVGGPALAVALRRRARRRRSEAARRSRSAALEAFVEAVGQSLRSGLPASPAILGALGADTHWGAVEAEVRSGRSLTAALDPSDALAADDPDRWLVRRSLALVVARGGPAVDVADRLALLLEDRRTALADAETRAAQARASAGLVAALPLAFAGLVAAVDPEVRRFLLASWPGAVCLGGSVGASFLGRLWIDRLVSGCLR